MELLDRLEREIKQRLDELRPAVDEARKLESALRRLIGQSTENGSTSTQSPSRSRARSGTASRSRSRSTTSSRSGTRSSSRRSRSTGKRVSGSERREQVITLVKANPEIKVRDIATELGTSSNNIYNIIRRLEADGKLTRADGRFAVPS